MRNYYRYCGRLICLALILSLVSCRRSTESAVDPNALTIHAASSDSVPGWNRMSRSEGGEIWVEPSPSLTLADFRSGQQTQDESGGAVIAVTFTPAGSEKLKKFSREHIGQMAAILVDGKLMNAPVIQSEISSHAIISGGGGAGLSPEQVERILTVISQR